MAADSNIFAQYLRPVKSMQDYGNDMDAAEQNRLTLAAGRMKAQQDQQAMADDSALRSAYQQSGGDPTKYRNALIGLGNAKAVQAFDAADLEAKGKRATIGKTDADTSASQVATTIKKLEHGASILSTAKDQQTYGIALQTLESVFPGASREMPPQFDPQVVAAKLATGQTIKEKLAAELAQSTLNQTVVRDTQTNDRGVASNLTAIRGQDMTAGTAKAGQAITVRGQDLVNARAKDATAQASKAPAGYRYKPDGTMEAIPGGPADLKNTAATSAKVTDAQDVLSLLDQALPLVEKSTGSYAGVGMDQAARVVGQSTEGSRAAAQLKVLEGSLISKMPKMSGPQSDKDVLLYKQMAGQIGDPTIPKDQKVAAMQTIREINERHAGGAAKPAGRTPVRTGKLNGRKVIEYSDGTTAYAD